MNSKAILTLLTIGLVLLVSCKQTTPTPTVVTQPPPSNTPTSAPSKTSTITPEPTSTFTLTPTSTPEPTFTPTPSATPAPSVAIQVLDQESGEPLKGATVRVFNDKLGFDASQTTDTNGQVAIDEALAHSKSYELSVRANSYYTVTTSIVVQWGENELTVQLPPQAQVQIEADTANLRSGPGTIYDVIGEVNKGDILSLIGQSDDGEWLAVEMDEGQGWLAANLVSVDGDLAQVVAMAAPPTPTPSPTYTPSPATPTTVAAVPAPPPAAPPAGENLLVNPGFEDGGGGWERRWGGEAEFFSLLDYPQFVRSGEKAAYLFASQLVYNVTPGVTYRLGAWARAWSSPDEDRSVSKDPGDIAVFVCINTNGDTNINLETSFCSNSGNPIDTWQYFSVDAIATTDRLMIILTYIVRSGPRHNEVFWDDAVLGVAPVAATPTPTPEPAYVPVRPQPIPFDGVALRDSMQHLQWVLEQMGGLLDRVYHGEIESCTEYESYYQQTIEITTFRSVPDDWLGVYNEYVWSADNIVATNDVIYSFCQAGGGEVRPFSYSIARSGIQDTLARLIPAIAAANGLLGQ